MRFAIANLQQTPLGAPALDIVGSSQSVLSALGPESARIATLSWIMFGGATLILVLVSAAAGVALYGPARWRRHLAHNRFVAWLGIAFPLVTLTALLLYGFATLRLGLPEGPRAAALKISVTGYQWWWRVVYHHADGATTESANELRIPFGAPVELALSSADVIHSFWVPAYAGKVDMVPGRTNYLWITASEPGLARGQCAEYCGGAHARMAFYVEALAPEAFEQWLSRERADAAEVALSARLAPGRDLFLASGCGGCHTVRGTAADGRIGPDLTHVGSRHSIGAGTLATTEANFERWLREHQALKPHNNMPPFDFLTNTELTQLARFLLSLE